VRGAFGELAVAKALGIYWPAAVNPTRHDPDLGDDIQVRCTGYRTGRLCHHPDDPAHHRYVLVVGDPLDRLDVVGWRWGADCRDDEYWTDPGGGAAWFVPQSDLTPIPERPGRHRA
jgi:hypothetical protein